MAGPYLFADKLHAVRNDSTSSTFRQLPQVARRQRQENQAGESQAPPRQCQWGDVLQTLEHRC